MKYYTLFDCKSIEAKIKDLDTIEKLNKSLQKGEFKGFEGFKIEINNEYIGDIIADNEEYYREFDDDEKFAIALSKILKEGELYIYFISENRVSWGYKIYPNKVIELYKIWKEGKTILTT